MNNEKYQLARQALCKFLKSEAASKGITQAEIAEKTGFKQPSVNRMLNGLYAPTLDNFIRLADAIGVNFFMESKDSPTDNNQAFEKAMGGIGRREIAGGGKKLDGLIRRRAAEAILFFTC